MRDLRHGLGLALEAKQRAAAHRSAKQLDRHLAIESGVVAEVHDAHASFADTAQHLEASDRARFARDRFGARVRLRSGVRREHCLELAAQRRIEAARVVDETRAFLGRQIERGVEQLLEPLGPRRQGARPPRRARRARHGSFAFTSAALSASPPSRRVSQARANLHSRSTVRVVTWKSSAISSSERPMK